MMVPRAYRYNATPSLRELSEKDSAQRRKKSSSPKPELKTVVRPASPVRTPTEPPRAPTPPVDVPTPERSRTAEAKKLPAMQRKTERRGSIRRASAHDPNALPPAVAALLAVTQIPRPRPNQFRRRSAASRNISIDELVNEWKSEDRLNSSLSSSPTLGMLLEDHDDEEQSTSQDENNDEEGYLLARSTSAESMPSLEDDDRSIMSNGSLPTPESMRSRKSTSNLKKDKAARSLPTAIDCATSHPLLHHNPSGDEDEDRDDGLILASVKSTSRSATPKPAKSTFTSNLTTSFQALKNALSSLTTSSSPPPQRSLSTSSPQFSDATLWSHPFLFPRFSSEVRPAVHGTPTEATRRYLNPTMPLIFDEVETPYQLALHADFLAEPVDGGAPSIQMQTYSRSKRKQARRIAAAAAGTTTSGGRTVDETSEAGRALLAAGGVKHREVRENSDFLRVVVLEMNMRKVGKLREGRARFWLPPREGSPGPGSDREEKNSGASAKVPARWVGVSAYQ